MYDVTTVAQAWAEELEMRARRVLTDQGQGEEGNQVRVRVSQPLAHG